MNRSLAAATLVLALVAGSRAAPQGAGSGTVRNVEILDPTMSVPDARRAMIAFNRALGVQCRDCHVLRDFASDEKPLKLVARGMMKMQRSLNEQWFAGRGDVVTCWSCHRGQRIPPQAPPLTGAAADSVRKQVDAERARAWEAARGTRQRAEHPEAPTPAPVLGGMRAAGP